MSKQERLRGIGIVQPKKAMIKISQIGFDTFSVGLSGKMEDARALTLCRKVCHLMAHQWGRDDEDLFQYNLALELLAELDFDKSKILEHLKKVESGLRDSTKEGK